MSVYEFGPFQLDAERLLLLESGEPVALGPKVVETLLALIEHPGDVLSKMGLLDRIWPEGYVDEANLAQNIYVLRKTLRASWPVDAIETIPRRGYRFTMPVRLLQDVPLAEPTVVPLAPAGQPRAPRAGWWRALAVAAAVAIFAGAAVTLLMPPRASATPVLSNEGARLYQIGRYYWNMRTPAAVRKSMDYFTRVIDTDPRDARGYAALASANAIMGDYDYGVAKPAVYFSRARAYAREALQIDPANGEAYAVLGMISRDGTNRSTGHMTEAIADLAKAIKLDPSSGPAHEWYGIALLQVGRFQDGYAELRRSAEIDPLSVATATWLSEAAYWVGRYDDAIAYANEALDLSPQRHDAYQILGLAYAARGDSARAIASLERYARDCKRCRPEAAALLADIYARSNRIADARRELALAQGHANDVSPDDLAVALAAVGQRSVALSVLRRMHGYDGLLRAEIATDPRFAVFRGVAETAQQKPA